MNSSEFLKEFRFEISNQVSCLARPDISRQAFELQGIFNCILYLKTRTTEKANWGITDKVILKLKNQNNPWFIILLSLKPNTGYLLSESDVDYYIKNLWHLNQDGDYKTATSFSNDKWFNTYDQLLSKINSNLNQQSSIDDILINTIREIRKKSNNKSAESLQHKNLKELIASNPSLIDLNDVIKTHIEYTFPSTDRVDIAFELDNDNWAVVEIELNGLSETIIGLFQAVKYKSIQEAVLKVKGLESIVTGYLVAFNIPPKTKMLAEILDIKTYEISEDKLEKQMREDLGLN